MLDSSEHELDVSVVRRTDESVVNSHIGLSVHLSESMINDPPDALDVETVGLQEVISTAMFQDQLHT